ncbi:hypothetical protein VTJ83DRAFT_5110 [Remersonia thermophila]|uniref:Trichothecene 3-O-acetyltransferase-like N-terminal domain-containing protein n=1 Tax=Remersonia thermophila TaxID=72144 RepID=A0ABR4DBU7_9PEZI
MPETTVYEIRPLGWENDPEEEKLKLSMLDIFSVQAYNPFTLFFKLSDNERPRALDILKKGLERTLAQCRHMVGTIEQDDKTYDCFFTKKRDTTGKLVVKYFGPEDGVPSMQEIEKAHYASSFLDVSKFNVEGLSATEAPENHPSQKPISTAFQANFIPGGLVFVTSQHHYTNDLAGWANFARQLGENCAAIANNTAPPPWDPANLDASCWTAPDIPDEAKVDAPPSPPPNGMERDTSVLLLHMPKSKASELKRLASPEGSDAMPKWISTYDAMCAILWRILTRHRVPLYCPDPDAEAPLALESVNLRSRVDPPLPPRQQRNIMWVMPSNVLPDPFTAREVAAQESEFPLARLAAKIRTMTSAMNKEMVLQFLAKTAPIRDKTRLFLRPNSFPPLSFFVTDWRDADLRDVDFGFGRPCAFRHIADSPDSMKGISVVAVYPPRPSENPDEGFEFLVSVENDILDAVLEDPDLKNFFDFRGFEIKTEAKEAS